MSGSPVNPVGKDDKGTLLTLLTFRKLQWKDEDGAPETYFDQSQVFFSVFYSIVGILRG